METNYEHYKEKIMDCKVNRDCLISTLRTNETDCKTDCKMCLLESINWLFSEYKEPKPKSVWDLKDGDEYWFINEDGEPYDAIWRNDDFDNSMRNIGNYFLTKEEAEFEAERRKCEAIMLKYGTRDMMSLGNWNNAKYCIMYDHSDCEIKYDYYGVDNYQGVIWFASKEITQQCIAEIGEDRLKKYIFNVKE